MRSMLFGCAAAAAAMVVAPAPAQAQFAGPLVAAPDIASNRTSVVVRDWRDLNRWRDLQHRYGWVDLLVGRLGDGDWALDSDRSLGIEGSGDWWRERTERRFPR